MAVVWGAYVYRDSYYGQRVGLDLTVSGTTITWIARLQSTGSMYASSPYSLSGAVSRSGNIRSDYGAGFNQAIISGTLKGSRGSTYTFRFNMTMFWGGKPSTSRSIKVPAVAPSKPAAPTMKATGKTTATSTLASAPANGGASITRYEWQLNSGSWISSGTSRTRNWTGLTPGAQYRVRVRAVNSAGTSTASNYSGYVTLDPDIPLAPTNMDAKRISDTTTELSWTNRSSSSAAYSGQRVDRRTFLGTAGWGSWAPIATISGEATSYTAAGQSANNVYQYRVVAINSSGKAISGSVQIRTTPDRPTNATAVKSDNDITVTATSVYPSTVVTYEWQDNPDGEGWVTLPGTTTTPIRKFLGPDPTVTHQYRLREVVASQGTPSVTLYSAWSSATSVVQLQAPPNAPTLTAPVTAAKLVRGTSVLFSWTHNPVDSTPQTEYELEIREPGAGARILSGTTARSRTVALADESGNGSWRVRTKGADPDWGPWSSLRPFTMGTVPSVSVTGPPDPLDRATAKAEWTYLNVDSSPQASFEARLWDASGVVLETRTGTTSKQTTFATVLENESPYTVEVRVTSQSGFVSTWYSREFSTDFPLPYVHTVTILWERFSASNLLSFNRSPANEAVNGSFEESREIADLDLIEEDGKVFILI